jgi:hypothetical protein
MKNKKGFLALETVIKVTIAVISIGILLYLGTQLFNIFIDQNNLEKAQAHMDEIERIINNLEEEGGGEREYLLLSPRKWALIAWPTNYFYSTGGELAIPIEYKETDIPDKCKASNWEKCLCFCEYSERKQNILFGCNELSICKPTEQFGEVSTSFNKEDERSFYITTLDIRSISISLNNDKLRIIRNE